MMMDSEAYGLQVINEAVADLHAGIHPDLDLDRLMAACTNDSDKRILAAVGYYLRGEVEHHAAGKEIAANLLLTNIEGDHEALLKTALEAVYHLPYRSLASILKQMNAEICNSLNSKSRSKYVVNMNNQKSLWFDLFLKVYLESQLHEENMSFGANHMIDMFRALLGSMVRDFRLIEEKRGTPHQEEVPIDLLTKFNTLFEYYFTGKLPDELKYMTLDQKDILKPLLATIWEYCLSKFELFRDLSQGYEELIVCEVYLLLANSLKFRSLTIENNLQSTDSLEDTTRLINEWIEQRLLMSLCSDQRNISSKFIRYCLQFVIKVDSG